MKGLFGVKGEVEFALWVTRCCMDARAKLELTDEQIVLILLQEIERRLVNMFLERARLE